MPRRRPPPKPARRRRGDGSISTAADGTIRARLPARVDPKRTAREFRPGQVAEAVAWLDAHLNPQPVEAAPTVPTLGQWRVSWWQTFVAPIRPPNTAAAYRGYLRHLAPLNDVLLSDLTTSQLQAIVGRLATTHRPFTIRLTVNVWRRCLQVAVEDELIRRNPASRLVLPTVPEREPARFVTAEEVAVLMPAIVGERFEAAFCLLLGMGLRIGTVLGLHWQHVDWREHRIWVQWQWTGGHWRDRPKRGRPHWAPMPQWVEATLRKVRRAHPDDVLVNQSPHVRRRDRKAGVVKPWSYGAVAGDLRRLVARCELEGIHPHAARHGLATALLAGGVPSPVIAARLGNTAAVVDRVYAHATDDGKARADALVEEYLGGVSGADTDATGDVRADLA